MTQFNVYIPGTTMFAHSSCCLHILLAHPYLYYYLSSPQNTVLHILFHFTFYPLFFSYFYFILTYIYIYSLVLCFIFLHCPLSGPVLIYISLLIISCIIEYVTNKRPLNLEPWTPCPRGLRQCWKIMVTTQNIDTLRPIWTFSLRGLLTFVASGVDINGCVLSYFEGTENVHCYTSCKLTTLHCSKVSFCQCCQMKIYNKIFTKMWGVYSLLLDTVYI